MPIDSILVSVAVVIMFVVFGAVLMWGDHQTSPKQLAQRADTSAESLIPGDSSLGLWVSSWAPAVTHIVRR
jgi:hypothetical protein